MDDLSINAGASACVQTLTGHRHRVSALLLVNAEVWSGSSDGTILIHDASSGEYLLTLQIPGKGGDDDVVSAMLFVQGYVWAASSDGSINIFNATTGKLITQLLGHTGQVTALTGTSRCVWSASGDQSVRGWDPDNGQLLHVLTGHNSWVRCVLAVDEFVWSGADDASIKIWHQQTGRLENDLRGHTAAVHCLLRVGLQVWSGGADKVIRVWAAQGGRLLKELRGHESWVNCLLLREPFVWSGSSDRSIRLWNAASGSCYKVFRAHTGWVWCLAGVGPDRVWSGSGDKTIRVWRDIGASDDGDVVQAQPLQQQQRVLRASVPSTGLKTAKAPATVEERPRRTLAKHRRRAVARDLPPSNVDDDAEIEHDDDALSDGGGFASHSWLADRRRNRRSPPPRDDAGMHALRAELSALRQLLPVAATPVQTPFVPMVYPQTAPQQYHVPPPVYAAPQPSHLLFSNGVAPTPQQPYINGAAQPARAPRTMAEREPIADDSDVLLQRKRELVAIEATLRSRRAEALELERQMDAVEEKQQAVQQQAPPAPPPPPPPLDDDEDRNDKEVDSLRARLATAEQQLADAQADQRRRTEAGEALRRELDDVRRREQELQRELANAHTEQRRLAALAAESANAQDSHVRRVEQLRDDLAASEARRERAEKALAEVQALRDRRVQNEDDDQRAERAAANERVVALVAQVSELERVVGQRESSLSAARESLLAARERIATLEADLLLSERHVAAAQQRAADDAAVFEQRIQVAESRSRDLAQQLNEHTQRAEAVEESHRVLTNAFAETVASQRELERQIELYVPLEAEVEMLRSKLDSLRLVAHTVSGNGTSTPAVAAAATMTPAHRAISAASAKASQLRSRQRAEAGREQMMELSARLKTLVQHATAAPAPRPAVVEVAGVDDATKRADAVRIERLKQARAKLFGSSSQQ